MKKIFLLLIVSAISLSMAAQQQAGNDAEIALVKKTIQSAYVEGLQNEGDTVKINSGFHPGFELLIPGKDGELKRFTLPEWKKLIKADLSSGKLPRKGMDRISIRFLNVDVTGGSAVAKFEFYVGLKQTLVGYLFLYKFGDSWKIVGKIFNKV